jgi:hypothetical protein
MKNNNTKWKITVWTQKSVVSVIIITKTLITNKMHKESFIINCNKLLHVSTLLGHLQGELFVVVTLRLHFTVNWECAVDCVLRCFWRRELSVVPACRVDASSTQSRAHSHSTMKCNLSVMITKRSPWRWPSRVETCRSVLQLMIKLSLCIRWWLVFLYVLSYPINQVSISEHESSRIQSCVRRTYIACWTLFMLSSWSYNVQLQFQVIANLFTGSR